MVIEYDKSISSSVAQKQILIPTSSNITWTPQLDLVESRDKCNAISYSKLPNGPKGTIWGGGGGKGGTIQKGCESKA